MSSAPAREKGCCLLDARALLQECPAAPTSCFIPHCYPEQHRTIYTAQGKKLRHRGTEASPGSPCVRDMGKRELGHAPHCRGRPCPGPPHTQGPAGGPAWLARASGWNQEAPAPLAVPLYSGACCFSANDHLRKKPPLSGSPQDGPAPRTSKISRDSLSPRQPDGGGHTGPGPRPQIPVHPDSP